jgi:NAD+ kinase
MTEKFADYLTEKIGQRPDVEVVGNNVPPAGTDIALSFGGDGTLLRTNRWVGDIDIPVAGVNTGHLGYLADYDLGGGIDWIDDIMAGNFGVESRTMLEVAVGGNTLPEGFPTVALNEVALLKRDTASMIEIAATAASTFLARYRADGVLVSTPTGSTAYNLSVGGPILQPTVPALVVAPIAPHSIGLRPMVISDDSTLTFKVKARAETFLLSVDGNSTPLHSGAEISVHRAARLAKVAMRPGHDYADALRSKLQWG